ncbi:CIA30 family protein [Paenibacillus kobensis]|uniref:CIA30 family protein n=1 Tax=Paenibacillus kobensis TaxID=59841 RepID=UPI0013E3EA88|nr:CIA30 family protein [Paenibacillus kobensis]
MRKSWISSLIVCLLMSFTPVLGAKAHAADMESLIARMGYGINMGNTLEPPYEGEWATEAREYYFDDYKAAGFQHVRIPIRWDNHMSKTYPYTIDESFLDRVEQIIDWSLSRGLITIIDSHHDEWIMDDYDANIVRFESIWKQIAERFQGKSNDLIFELLNEPHGNITDTQVNDMNSRLVSLIRDTNPDRPIIIGAGGWNSWRSLVYSMEVPNDPNLIATFHYYDPYTFTHELTGTWGSESDQLEIRQAFAAVQAWSEKNHIPVYLGEYGARVENDRASRLSYYDFVSDLAARSGFPSAVWDDEGWFKVYDRGVRTFDEDIVHNILNEGPFTWPDIEQPETVSPPAFPPVYAYGEQTLDDFDQAGDAWGSYSGNEAAIEASIVPNGSGQAMQVAYTGSQSGYWGVVQGLPTDLSPWVKLAVDVKGSNSNSFNLVLTENGNGGDGEQWKYTISPTNSWSTFVIPFDHFTKRTDYQPPGEDANNVLNLNKLTNIQLLQNNAGSGTIQVDNIRVIGLPEGTVQTPALTAEAGNAQVALHWKAATGAQTYTVQRAESSGEFVTVAEGITGLSYTDSAVTNGTSYQYQVVAVNTAGTALTNTASAAPVAPFKLKAQYRALDPNPSNNSSTPNFIIRNDGENAVELSSVKLRYYFTKDSSSNFNFWTDYAAIGRSNVSARFVAMSNPTASADTYVELTFKPEAGTLAAGANTGEIHGRFSPVDWMNMNELNDYSFHSAAASFADADHVTLYVNDSLVWGVEPS